MVQALKGSGCNIRVELIRKRQKERGTEKQTQMAEAHVHPKLNEKIEPDNLRSRIKLQKKLGLCSVLSEQNYNREKITTFPDRSQQRCSNIQFKYPICNSCI